MKGPQLQASDVPSAGTPNFKPYAAPETTSTSDSAASHYDDMSLIPDTRVFFPPTRPSVALASPAETILKTKGIYSHDPLLDHNPEELWRFLASHLQSPLMVVRIEGTHTVRTGTGKDRHSHTVTDFSIQLDVSRYVNPQWSRIFTNPASHAVDAATAPTVRETLEEYAGSKNALKEFSLNKFVEWDFEELTQSLKGLVRSTGYRSTVTITFPMQGYKVVTYAPNQFSKAAHSKVAQVVFWPAWAIARKRTKNRLACAYGMAAGGAVFYARNHNRICNAVEQRLKKDFVTAL